MIKAEGYQNYQGKLRVGIHISHGIDRILTREEAERLRAELTAALAIPDKEVTRD